MVVDPHKPKAGGIIVGISLAIVASVVISIALNLQKYAHNRLKDFEDQNYLKSKIWWLGMILLVSGEFGNFIAYGFAPATIVAPLGAMTIVANVVIAHVFLKELLRVRDLFGIVLVVVGAFLIVNFAGRKNPILNGAQLGQLLLKVPFIIYLTSETILFIVLFFMEWRYKKHNVFVLLIMASLLASLTIITAKGVSSMMALTLSGHSQFNQPILYVFVIILGATAALQIKFINLALAYNDVSVVVPVNYVFFSLSAIMAGIMYYNEFGSARGINIIMFIFGCCLSFFGIYIISGDRSNADSKEYSKVDKDGSDSEELLLGEKKNGDIKKYVGGEVLTYCQPEVEEEEADKFIPKSDVHKPHPIQPYTKPSSSAAITRGIVPTKEKN
ncbi:NIPA-like protein 2 [Trichoplax sp. H2]|nr:NIPA-like protein 2 [Trichoplax sp. H2]|eukprot:RDD46202.1 NIPA-like protein 2 [Trichoplax sp. H2]